MSEKKRPYLQTPAQRMLDVLADGEPHSRAELHSCLNGGHRNRCGVKIEGGPAAPNSIHYHLHAVRHHIALDGEVLIRVGDGYQRVRPHHIKSGQHVRVDPLQQ